MTATAECFGLRPVANAFGCSRRDQVEARDGIRARVARSSTSATSSGASPGSSGRARLILSAMRSENQYIARLKTTAISEERDDPAGAADEPADRDEERREPGEQDPGAHTGVHVDVSFLSG